MQTIGQQIQGIILCRGYMHAIRALWREPPLYIQVANEILDYHRQCPEQKIKEANAVTPVSLQQYDIER